MNTELSLPLLVELLAKSLVILTAAALIVRAWRSASAAQRHLVWCVAFGALLLLPATRLVEPRWALPMVRTAAPVATVKTSTSAVTTRSETLFPVVTPAEPVSQWQAPDWRVVLMAIWLGGTALLLTARGLASIRLRLLRKASTPVRNQRVLTLAREAFASARLHRPVDLRVAAGAAVPLTWGTWRPVILLPEAALAWTDARLLAALRHEAAHVANADHLVRFFAHLACALYWPNPLVWVAARRLRVAQEQAADDLVLCAGTAPEDYAAQLFDVARTLAAPRGVLQGAVAMACPSTLERRMLAIVDASRNRRPLSGRAVVGGVLAVTLTLGLATAAQLQAQTPPATTTPPASAAAVTPPAPSETTPAPGAPQIQIEAKFIEFSGDQASLPDLLKPAPDESAPGVRGVQAEGQAKAIIRALEGLKGVDVLSSPRILTVSGHRATMEIIREFRYPTAFEKDPKTNEWAPSAFDTKNVGITFDVTPEVKEDGTIALRMSPEATEFEGFLDLDAGGDTAKVLSGRELTGPDAKTFPAGHRKQPIFSTRKMTTEIAIKPGDTVVLGALNREDVQKVEDKVPVLGDIPVVGGLFTSKTERRTQRRLFVFVTASLVEKKKSAASGTPQPLQLTADSTSYDAKTGEAKASGNVEIKTPGATIRAEQATVIPTNQPAAASPAGNEPGADDPAAKLILPKLELRDAKLGEAIAFLVEKSRDGGAAGFNVVVKAKRSPEPTLTLSLANVSWRDALRYVAELGGYRVRRDANAFVLEAATFAPENP